MHPGRRFAHEHQVRHTDGFETGRAAISSPSEVFSNDHGALPRGQVARKGDEPEVHEDSVRASAALRDPPLDAGHYGWGDKVEAYGSRVVDWVSGGCKRVAR